MGCESSAQQVESSSVPVLFGKVQRAMKQADWKFTSDQDRGLIIAVCGNADLTFFLRVFVYEDKQIIGTRIILERACPPAARRGLTVWCNKKNWERSFGFFYVDLDDGELGFRDSMDVEHVEITAKSIDNLLKRPIAAMQNNYAEILTAVALFSSAN
jgi:hypothetical protein